ncbi:putative folate-biopterin transporter 4 [Nicotiana attenuata]|uniref:Folate-biopterin transporter 4 n=1 Tax=Nicotiana attenuata TaxID=49451 RepID=A0A1J6IVU8_NICAT|nr:putative folate-biopterin transporter 4 [Nicotiana attenuata]
MMGWLKQLCTAFGASFLWLVCLIYFTQGFRSFVWTAVSYQLKDNLKLSPSASQFVTSIAFFPWSIKPLYGILSDCFPIRGRKRVPYLTLATLLSLLPWLILGLSSFLRNTRIELMILLTVQNLGSAMADVVIDAMIAEAVRFERASFAGDLQSISWLAMAFGGICGSLLGGYALLNLQIDRIFLLFSVLPALQLFSCGLVEEGSVQGKAFPECSASNGSEMTSGSIEEDKFSGEKSKISTLRRKKSQKNSKRAPTLLNKLQAPDKNRSSFSQWYQSLKMATYTLFSAFRQPAILR